MREIKVRNTLSKKKEPLTPIEPGHVRIYACGVTVYDDCHIGHAMQAIFFDVMRRYLEYVDYKVTYVRNYTDVDDKIIDRARERGMSPKRLAEDMIANSERDLNDLGVRPANHEPKVSEHIPEIIAVIESLIEKGFAYATEDGDVYYRVRKKSDYGKLSNRNPDDMRSGEREITEGKKEDVVDFALWKSDDAKDASWQSPWGVGRPGWHIECSAMAKKFLGDHFDIHGGGRDLIFPHHENEIAQSEAANDSPYANCWLHSGLMTINDQKMSKSLGNHITIEDFLKSWPAEVLKLSFVERHYGSNINFSDQVFRQSQRRLLFFYETVGKLRSIIDVDLAGNTKPMDKYRLGEIEETFHRTMCDDFNTAQATAALGQLIKLAGQLTTEKKTAPRAATAGAMDRMIREYAGVLGILTKDPQAFVEELKQKVLPELGISEDEIAGKIAEREEARKNKDWAASDEIRDALAAKGIELRDEPGGTKWAIQFQGD